MEEVDITPAQDGGVLKRIIKEGTGDETAPVGSTVVVHYTGTFTDGRKFDSSRDRKKPFKFSPGLGKVIRAWEIGVITMKKGEIAVFTCAPEYAYGDTDTPTIPANSTLIFEIEMISWNMSKDISPNKDGSIKKTVVTPGKPAEDFESALIQGSLVHVHLTGTYEDRVFEDRDVSFYLGEAEEHDVIPGVDIALATFRKGEVSKVKIKPQYAFPDGHPEYGIPPNSTVVYTIELKDFEEHKPDYLLTTEEIRSLKEKGTTYYKANKYEAAIKMYSRVEKVCTPKPGDSTEKDEERENLFLTANLNLALCYLKTDKNARAIEACDKVLEIDPKNEKALFRRGQAYLGRASPEEALRDFQEVVKIEPKNAAAARQIVVCNNLIKKQREKEKRLYTNMFDKFAREDKQNEEEKLRQQPDVMHWALGEWGQEERPGGRDATAFEKENPNILMLNANGTGEFQNM